MVRDWRDDEIDRLRARDVAWQRQVESLTALVMKLTARVQELEAQLRKSSRNSSKPPSSDGPAVPARPAKTPTGRKRGGQPGHERSVRPLEPAEKARTVVDCIPERCGACSRKLHGRDANPQRHQVFDLPKVEPFFDEYRIHSLSCACGRVTCGQLPQGVSTGAFGPGVVAVVALLMGVFRLTKRMVPELMADLYGLHLSVGAVVGCQRQASEALASPVEQARQHVVEDPRKHADETGWREGPRRTRAWLWVAVTEAVVVFMVHARRNGDAAKQLLVRAKGVLVSDRHGAYGWWPDALRQFCWAHLRRDAVAIQERGGTSATVGRVMLDEIDRMFHWWHRVRDGTLKWESFQVYMRSLRLRFEAALRLGVLSDQPKTAKTCAKLLRHFDSLWTFVRVRGVEPTNNPAEQVIRHAVIIRKISGGTHSEAGSRFVERILTVHATLRRQNRNILEFLREACVARLQGSSPPSLLPTSFQPAQLAAAA